LLNYKKIDMNTTFKILSLMLIVSVVSMGGCLKKLTTANFDHTTTGEITTEEVDKAGEFSIGETTLTSTLKDELNKNNTAANLVDALKLRSAEVSIAENQTLKNFDAIDNAELYISADNQPEVLLASVNPVQKDKSTISFVVSNNTNLMSYLNGNTFTISIKGKTNGPLQVVKLNVKAIWTVTASAK